MDDTLSPDNGMDQNSETIIENPELERLQLYRNIIQEAVSNFTSCVNADQYSDTFKDLQVFKNKPSLASSLYNTLTEYVRTEAQKEFEEHIIQDEVQDRFSKLDDLIKINLSNHNVPAWRPSHSVEDNVKSYVMQEKMKLRDQLKEIVYKEEVAVNALKYKAQVSREQVEKIIERLNNVSSALENIDGQINANEA